MKVLEAVGSGAAGAATVTVIHETARQFIKDAPRSDVLGIRALDRAHEALNEVPPTGDRMRLLSLIGDLVANTLYYSLVSAGSRRGAWLRGSILGLLAGLGALVLPGPLGLGTAPTRRTRQTELMTVLWYLLGGLAAAAVSVILSSRRRSSPAP